MTARSNGSTGSSTAPHPAISDRALLELLGEAARASSIPLGELIPSPHLAPGAALLEGRFGIRRVLGEGATGVAYEAFDRERENVVALKILRRSDPASILHFQEEFRSLTNVIHPSLVRLHGLYTAQDRWFFTMDLVQGVAFSGAFVGSSRCGTPRWERLRNALSELADGVSAIHRAGKIHRDLKPSNVLVSCEGHVTIVDYGLVVDPDTHEPHGAVSGTEGYIAPERYAGSPATQASDWYAVGVMLRQVLALPPSDAPAELAALAAGLTRDDPAERYGCAEIRDCLRENNPDGATSASSPALATTFVGRRRELAALHAAHHTTLRGQLVACRVHGVSGIGKTTLVQAFVGELKPQEVVVLSGRCREREFTPRRFLEGVIEALVDSLGGVPLALSSTDLESYASLGRLFPALVQLPEVARARSAFDTKVDALEHRRRAIRALCALLARVSADRALVVHIDDAQWADLDGTTLCRDLLEHAPPLLLLVTMRGDERSEAVEALFDALRAVGHDVRELEVRGLDADETVQLSRRICANAEHVQRIAAESGGHPYFARELARHTAAGDRVAAHGKPDLDRVLAQHVGSLPPLAADLLALVAIAAAPLALRTLSVASGPHELDRRVSVLRAEGLVRTRLSGEREQLDVYHDRVREVVLRGLSDEQARDGHLRVAAALEATAPEQVELLSMHHAGAGSAERAAHYAVLAAQRAAEALAFDRAAEWYSQALASGQWPADRAIELQTALGHALVQCGRNAAAADAFEAALGRAGRAVPMLQLQRAAQLLYSGRFSEGLPALDEACRTSGWPIPRRAVIAAALALFPEIWWRSRRLRLRPAMEIAPDALARVDACYWAALGLAGDSRGIGAYMMLRAALEALRVGEPLRIARCSQYIAAMTVVEQPATHAIVGACLALSTRVERHVRDPRIAFWHAFRNTFRAYWQFDTEAMTVHWDRAQALLDRNRYHGVDRERVLLGIIGCLVATQQGDAATYRVRLERFQVDARQRRDEYAAAFGEVLDIRAILDGDAVTRCAELHGVIERYRRSAGTLMALPLSDAELQLARFERVVGRLEQARDRAFRIMLERRSSAEWRSPLRRSEALREAAGCTLALAASCRAPRALLREAEALMQRDPSPASWQAPARAAIAWLHGDRGAALGHLEIIAQHEAALGVWLTSSAHVASGCILGGAVGRARIAHGQERLRRAGYRDPRLVVRTALPGLPCPD